MRIGITLFVVIALILAIWIFIEVRRFRHKALAIFLIVLILFTYLSFTSVIKEEDIDFKTITGLTTATKLYFSWLGSIFGNLKTITTNAIRMNWKDNATIEQKK